MLLFVDDELYALAEDIDALREAGFKLEVQKSPARALEAIRELGGDEGNQLELAILDVMMDNAPDDWDDAGSEGERAGLALADRIRKLYPKLPIIFLTNQRDGFVLEQVKNYQNAEYRDKRISTPQGLVKAVREFLARSSYPEAEAARPSLGDTNL